MPEFELDLRNVESEVVDGVTVIKSAELTAVSRIGASAEDQWHSYRVGELVGGELRMYDDPIDEGPITGITPEEFLRGVDRG